MGDWSKGYSFPEIFQRPWFTHKNPKLFIMEAWHIRQPQLQALLLPKSTWSHLPHWTCISHFFPHHIKQTKSQSFRWILLLKLKLNWYFCRYQVDQYLTNLLLRLCNWTTWVWILDSTLASCVILEKLVNLCEPCFSHQSKGFFWVNICNTFITVPDTW